MAKAKKLPEIEVTDESENAPDVWLPEPADWYFAIWGYLCICIIILFFCLTSGE